MEKKSGEREKRMDGEEEKRGKGEKNGRGSGIIRFNGRRWERRPLV